MYKSRLIALAIILVVFTTITYSALATNLAITGEATIRAVSDIRVTDIDLDKAENDAVEEYAPKYTKNTITNGIKLPSNNSSISYTVEITNKGDIDEAIYGLNTVSNNNGLHILINGEEINSVLPMIIPYRTTREITITYWASTPSNEAINIVNTFDFREVYYITYNTKGGSEIQRQIKYQNVDINLTQERPTKTGYVFTGWTDEQNGTQIKYAPGDLYTLNQNKTLYAIYRQGEATFKHGEQFNVLIKQLANPNVENMIYEYFDTNITSIQRYTSGVPSVSTLANAVKVSTDTSDLDIYAWYSNGTIYYYTEAFNPYMNIYSQNMFRRLGNVQSIDISTVNTSRVGLMMAMFMDDSNLSMLNLNNFDTSSLGDIYPQWAIYHMFDGCSSLTSIDLSTFNTSKVTNMAYLFSGCTNLASITFGNNWNTSNVTNMQYMFNGCRALTSLNLSAFITSNVENMSYMFSNCQGLLNINLNNFNTSKVTNMEYMFNNCYGLTNLNLSVFNTSNVINMKSMFYACIHLTNLNISSFNTSIVEDMSQMFNYNNYLTSLDISNFNMSSVTNVTDMFTNMPSLTSLKTPSVYPNNLSITLPKTLYDVNGTGYSTLVAGNPTQTWIKLGYTVVFDKNNNDATGTMSNQIIQFDTATQLHTNTYTRYGYVFTGWNTAADGSGTAYLDEASVNALASANGTITLYAQWREGEATFVAGPTFNMAIKQLANPNSTITESSFDDYNITSIEKYTSVPSTSILSNSIVLSHTKSDYDIYVWYDNGKIYYYTEAVNLYLPGSASFMFRALRSVSNIDLSNVNSSRTREMYGMFLRDKSLETLDLSSFNTINVENMGDMFAACSSLVTLNLSNFITTNNTSMWHMFNGCSSLTELNLSSFNTSNVTSMEMLFYNCKKLKILDLGNFNINSATNTTNMFNNMESLEQLKTPNVIPSGMTITLPKTLYDEEGNSYTNLTSSSPTEEWLRIKYNVTFDSNKGNLLYGLDDTNGQIIASTGKMQYSISNEVITVTALSDDGYGFVGVDVYLESEKNYIFNADSSGLWYDKGNQVEAVIMIDGCAAGSGGTNCVYKHIQSNENYEFTVPRTGVYHLRLDVNQSGQTHTFSNISIVEKNETKSVIYNQAYGTLPANPTREGYAFAGWNGKNLLNYNNLLPVALSKDIVIDNNGYISDSTNTTDNRQWYYEYSNWHVNLKSGTYTIRLNFSKKISSENETAGFRLFYEDGTDLYGTYNIKNIDEFTYSFTLENNSNIGIMIKAYDGVYKIQLEEGNTATAWEPYYITSSTTVVQDKDHTLTAKWIPNTYSIVFDKNDNAATGTMNNQSMTYGTSSNLTKNTYKKTGYVFMGWNTASDGSGIAYLDEASVNALTPTNNETVTLYAQWREGEATFIEGNNFNYMIKELAGDDTSSLQYRWNFNDYNITSFERNNSLPNNFIKTNDNTVSTNDSDYDIYVWYENGTIYYYTEAINVYMNSYSSYMFKNLRSLSLVDLESIYSNRTRYFAKVFDYCVSLTKVDLSGFDLNNIIDNYSLGIDMTSLEQLKTPSVIRSGMTISLSKTMYDENGNAYTQLDSTTPTEEWLRIPYTVTANANGGTISSTTGWTSTGNTSTKSVLYNQTYGTLPSDVTKSGYTLAGWSLLPSGYTQVDYIQSSGTQYIDTEYYWTNENIGIHFDGTVLSNSTNQSLFGNEENISNEPDIRNFAGIPHGKNGVYAIYLGSKSHGVINVTVGTKFTLDISTSQNKNVTVDVNKSNVFSRTYEGSVMTHDTAYLVSNNSTTVGNIFIFANHNTSRGYNNDPIQNISSMRLYSFKMYDNNVLVRDFIPCINDTTGKVGLYDLVEGKFYGNKASGDDFTYGSKTYVTSSTVVEHDYNHSLYAVWEANKYNITYNLQNNTTYTNPQYDDTNYYIDWSKDFEISGTFNVSSVSGRHLIVGSYSGTTSTFLSLEFTGRNALLYIGNGTNVLATQSGVYENEDVDYTLTWDATNKLVTVTMKGTQTDISMSATKDISYTDTNSLRIGTQDCRGTAEFNSITMKNMTITEPASYGTTYSLLNATKKGYTLKGWTQEQTSELPSNYAQVEYIESTGTQYIDTGYVPKTTTKIELDLSFNGDFKNYSTYGGQGAFLGVYDSNTQVFSINFGGEASAYNYLYPWFNKRYQYDGTLPEAFSITNNIRTNRNTLTIENGKVIYGTVSKTISSKEVNQSSSMYIFGKHGNMEGELSGPFTEYNMRVYEMKIYENDVLVRYYVPVLNKTTNKLGLYEIVNGVFYGNIGTGEFNAPYITEITTVAQAIDHSLYAIWEPNTYNVVFDKNSNDATGTMNNQSMTYGTSSNLTKNTYKKTGYVFMGWNTASDGSGTAYLDEASVSTLTPTNNGTVTLYAQWREGEATFISGTAFNETIKQLANPTIDNMTFDVADTNITSIQRYTNVPTNNLITNSEIFSTNDSDYDIYVWYENGIIYYYTEAINIYTNYTSTVMFANMMNLSNIEGLSYFNTSRTNSMMAMFQINNTNYNQYGLGKITDLTPLSNWDTSNLISTNQMFKQQSIINIDSIKNWNISNVSNAGSMFYQCANLTKIDMSNYDMNSITNVDQMLYSVISLEQLKTPSVIPSGITIDLPKTMYDEDGNAYTQLDSNSPTEEWLRIPYTVTLDSNGGNIPLTTGWTGTGNTSTKSVIYNQQYGTLPEPTREGYEFKGWTNQNNFHRTTINESHTLRLSNGMDWRDIDYIVNEGEEIIFDVTIPDSSIISLDVNDIEVSSDSYTISGDRVYGIITITPQMRDKYSTLSYKFLDINSTSIIYKSTIVINEFRIISKNTTKNQIDSNHTLTAIWEPATYTVTFDDNLLASGYQRVEYIESTGTQYILTNIVPADTTGVHIKLASIDTTNDRIYFGSGYPSKRYWIGNYGNKIYFGWNNINNNSVETVYYINDVTIDSNTINTLEMNYLNDREFVYNGVTYHNNLETLIEKEMPMTIFGYNMDNSGGNRLPASMRLYEFKVSDGNNIIANFIPCINKATNKAGLYEMVNGVFYGNQGTGDFNYSTINGMSSKQVTYNDTYGTMPTNPIREGYTFKGWASEIESELPSNYAQVEYIESTRTQYIDTGYVPKTTTKLELDLSFNGDLRNSNVYGGISQFLGVTDSNTQMFTISIGDTSNARNTLYAWINKTYQYEGQGYESIEISDNTRSNRNKLIFESGNITYGTTIETISTKENDNINSMYIFGKKGIIGVNGAFTTYNMRVYEMKIYENDVLVRHYVPVLNKSTHKLGLYEIENNVFYGNQGTGEFNAPYTTSSTLVSQSNNHMLYAMWIPNTYTINYDGNGSTSGSTASSTHTYDISSNLTTNGFSRMGYTFTGWNTAIDGTGTAYLNEASIKNILSTNNGSVTLYAQWVVNTYSLTFDINYQYNNTFEIYTAPYTDNEHNTFTKSRIWDDEIHDYVMKFTITGLPNSNNIWIYTRPLLLDSGAQNSYQYFIKSDKEINNSYYIGVEHGGQYGQTTYTTQWQKLSKTFVADTSTQSAFYIVATGDLSIGDSIYLYGLSIESGDNSGNQTIIDKTYGTTIGTLPTEPTRSGYQFDGWYTDPVGGTKISSSTQVPSNNTTYYAHWKKEFTVTNLVQNGSFESGFDNWTKMRYSDENVQWHTIDTNYKMYGSNSLARLANPQNTYNFVSQNISFIEGHKYYYFLYGYTNSSVEQIFISDIANRGAGISTHLTNDQGWVKLATIYESQYTESKGLSINYYETTDITYVDGIGVVDLTATFGAGNEPTSSWCYSNINYFDGTTTIYR